MSFNLDSHKYGPVLFKPVIPASFAQRIVPDSDSCVADGKFGLILAPRRDAGKIQMRYTMSSSPALDFSVDQSKCFINTTLENKDRLAIYDGLSGYQEQGQFNRLRSSPLKGTFNMDGVRRDNSYLPAEREKSKSILPAVGKPFGDPSPVSYLSSGQRTGSGDSPSPGKNEGTRATNRKSCPADTDIKRNRISVIERMPEQLYAKDRNEV